MLYEIINPSDPYTIEAESLDVAFVACIVLGEGKYEFDPIGDDEAEKIPLFLFGGVEEWCLECFKEPFDSVFSRVMKDKKRELAACLDSCLIGDSHDRETYLAGLRLIDDPVKRDEWHERWHDQRRSSVNDIGGLAREIAARVREKNNG